MEYKKIVTVVLDSVGIGEAHDASNFGDFGVDTLGNISKHAGLELPNLEALGLGNISEKETIHPVEKPRASYGIMKEVADGKDTMTGHWEMMGCVLHKGFTQYVSAGFPDAVIQEFEERTGRKVLANKEANGMKVINEYYDEHMATGNFIVYTSVDSTFQIAAHEDVIPLEELYAACEIAREITARPEYNVARVIARPFIGEKESVERTANRHDYALVPFTRTALKALEEEEIATISVGKIYDIFSGDGIGTSILTKSNDDGITKTVELLQKDFTGFGFVNLVDFDSKYGHPRDVEGYRDCLEAFDARLPELLAACDDDTLLILTADHGNDPTYKGNDHTREYVPLLAYSTSAKGTRIPDRSSFVDLGKTICDNFDVTFELGESFLDLV